MTEIQDLEGVQERCSPKKDEHKKTMKMPYIFGILKYNFWHLGFMKLTPGKACWVVVDDLEDENSWVLNRAISGVRPEVVTLSSIINL